MLVKLLRRRVVGSTCLLGIGLLWTDKNWLRVNYEDQIKHSSVMRFTRAASTIVLVMADYKYTLMGVDKQDDRYAQLKSECHSRCALRFKQLCSVNGGVFMKIGQHIGSLDLLFPAEYVQTLKCFQYQAPASSMEDVRMVLNEELQQPMDRVFSEFEQTPVGCASLAQVHKAVLKNGDVVAVKVQHRAVKDYALSDAKVIEFFVKVAMRLFPEFQFQWLVDEIKSNLPLETDFLQEARNCTKMANVLKHVPFLKIPKVYMKESTSRMLLMEFCEGGTLDDLQYMQQHQISPSDISSKMGMLYSEMIFVQGFIHCDPHPGNVLINKDEKGETQLTLLDHGLYQTLPDELRLAYCQLWTSMINRDMVSMKDASMMLGVSKADYKYFACMVSGRSWRSIESGIDKKPLSEKELCEVQKEALQVVHKITGILERLPRQMVLIFKTNDLLRGLDARLGTKVSLITMIKHCVKAKYNSDFNNATSNMAKFSLSFSYLIFSLKMWCYETYLTTLLFDNLADFFKL